MTKSAIIPASMRSELQAWNGGEGIGLESWVGCTGTFALAVGYASVFCPEFFEFEGYILRGSAADDAMIQNIRGFESQPGATPRSIEWVLNHIHIADIQYHGCPDIAADKLVTIGTTLKKIYEARLALLFPNKPCVVEFHIPDNPEAHEDYQLSFWQVKHE